MTATRALARRRFLAVLLGMVSLLAALWVGEELHYRSYVEARFADVARQAEKLCIAFEEHTQGILRYSDLRISAVRAEFALHGSLVAARQMAAALPADSEVIRHLSIADAQGNAWTSGSDGETPLQASPQANLSDRDYFIFHRDHAEDALMVWAPMAGKIFPEVNFRLTRRLNAPDGSFAGVVIANISPAVIANFYERFDLGPNASVALLNTDHTLIARRGPTRDGTQPLGQRLEGQLWQRFAENRVGSSWEVSPADGIVRLFAFRGLSGAPLLVDVGVADNDVRDRAAGYHRSAMTVTGLASLVVVLGAVAIWAQMVAGMRLRRANRRAAKLSSHIASILDSLVVSVFHLKNRRIVYANRCAQEMFGYSGDELVGADTRLLYAEDDDYKEAAGYYPSLQHGPVLGKEVRFLRKDGGDVWCRSSGRLIDAADSDAGTIWVLDDISVRKAAQDRLKEVNDRLKLATAAAALGVWDWNVVSGQSNWDERMFDLYGIPAENPVAQETWTQQVHPDDAPAVLAALHQTVATGEGASVEFRIRRPDGEERWLRMAAGAVVNGSAAVGRVVGINYDITERKHRERQLALYRSLVEFTSDSVYAASPAQDFRLQFVNEAACWHFGALRDDLLNWRLADWNPNFSSPESRQALWREVKDKRALLVETTHRMSSGAIIPVEVSLNYLDHEGEEFLVGHFHDISGRRAAEQALAGKSEELARSNAELEAFAYVASHDLREPLRMISAYIGLIERRHGQLLNEEAQEFLAFARDGARRMDRLIVDLLEYSRIGRRPQAPEPVELQAVMAEVALNLSPAMDSAGGRLDCTSALPVLMGDKQELVRLLQNLVGNGIKYRPADRAPVVSVSAERDGAMWHICVTDNGIGIPADQCERVFGIFQRLHGRDQYEGTGIGLAVCKKIVERYSGRIWVDSVPGEGSTFHFTLPASMEQTH
jgi:PAS domain S-box-containing protein